MKPNYCHCCQCCHCSCYSEKRKWDAYLKYLKDWADSHEDPFHLGMSPVCYDEFIDNDYRF